MDDLLLHACCGPCCTVAVPAWRAEGLTPRLYFYNPNIQPACEFERRLVALRRFAAASGCELTAAQGGESAWLAVTAAGAAPPEQRCAACLALRLGAAARAARAAGGLRFATSLTVSPHQRHDLVRETAEAAAADAGVEYLHADLRPYFARSYDESRRLGLYRQAYCGCVPSKWEARLERLDRRRTRLGERPDSGAA
jgi:predicted adenine nucleotide alpha hydrolase (AANH) superfamily ATPase